MMMVRHRSPSRTAAGLTLVVLGLAIVLIELARYWRVDHPIHPMPVIIGGVIALFGAYVLDPKVTKGGGTFIVDQASRVIAVIRTGRRSTDVVAVKDDGTAQPVAVTQLTRPPVSVEHIAYPRDKERDANTGEKGGAL